MTKWAVFSEMILEVLLQDAKKKFTIMRKHLARALQPFKCQPHKIVKHTQTVRQQQARNCLSVFDHFVGFTLKGLS